MYGMIDKWIINSKKAEVKINERIRVKIRM